MTALAGIAAPDRKAELDTMLQQLSYRGDTTIVYPAVQATLGVVVPEPLPTPLNPDSLTVSAGRGHFARVKTNPDGVTLSRDPLGVVPLYYGYNEENVLYFASEVKALLPYAVNVEELPPGMEFSEGKLKPLNPIHPASIAPDLPAREIAAELRRRLANAVEVRAVAMPDFGSLLSGGLDSTIVAALARPYTAELHTFSAGLAGAPDLLYARKAAKALGCIHHERVLTLDEMIALLPEVIFHLESFDALLVRSSILHYAAAKMAVGTVAALFSGEGADELFAGYDYLKQLPQHNLPAELNDLTRRLHNTALQRVDRCIQAHGITGLVPMLDPRVVEFSRAIPVDLKLHEGVEKWILRQASAGLLPEEISRRPKAKFWQGGGVGNLLARYADGIISNTDFANERRLPNGWLLNTREELLYYRIFRQHFGEIENLDWLGRTKGSPVQSPVQ